MEQKIRITLNFWLCLLTVFLWCITMAIFFFSGNTPFSIVHILPLFISIITSLFFSMVFAKILSNKFLAPFNRIQNGDTNFDPDKDYPELKPIFAKIVGHQYQIKTQEEQLNFDKTTFEIITQSMKEGLILIGENHRIVSLNPSAFKLLAIQEGYYIDRSYEKIGKNPELLNCIKEALDGNSANCTLKIDHRFCRIYTNPILTSDNYPKGAIVLLLDVTQREKSESLRREFSANVSHELKTPITSIHGYAELIANELVENPVDTKKFAERILTESSRLRTLVEDIIHLSRLDEGGSVHMTTCNLDEIIAENLNYLQPIANKNSVTLIQNSNNETVTANMSMMQELVGNLCENAIKYNRKNGSVSVTTSQTDSTVILAVTDTGIGIDTAHHDLIFQRFYRVDKSRSKQTGGTGLGLSIVKHIVELHNGDIHLESTKNVGTTIKIIFQK